MSESGDAFTRDSPSPGDPPVGDRKRGRTPFPEYETEWFAKTSCASLYDESARLGGEMASSIFHFEGRKNGVGEGSKYMRN